MEISVDTELKTAIIRRTIPYRNGQNVGKAFKESLNRINDIINFLPDATIVIDKGGKTIAWNKAAEILTGVKAEQMLGKNSVECAIPFYGSERPLLVNLVTNYSKEWAEKNYFNIEISDNIMRAESFCPAIGNNGIYIRITASPLYDLSGNIVGAIESMRDITAEKKAIEALKNSEEMYRRIVETANEGILIINKKKNLAFANQTIAELLGYRVDELLGTSFYNYIKKGDIFQTKHFLNMHRQKINEKYDMELVCKNGKHLSVIISASPILDADENYIGSLAMITDITEHKEMEKHMAQLDRLNLIGKIAAGIGHEIRNPLTSVRGFLQLMKEKDKHQEDAEFFKIMIEELDRANSIITEFLSLSKNRLMDLKKNNLNDIINFIFPLITAEALAQDKHVYKQLQDIPDLLLDEREIRQLLLNLVKNGLDAISCGKCITVKTYLQADRVVLAVHDEGPGIDAAMLNEIANPFFSTKDQGAGLGLPICYSIAARHNATIDIQSSSRGTIFIVQFNNQPVAHC